MHQSRRNLCLLTGVLLALGIAGTAGAAVIYDNGPFLTGAASDFASDLQLTFRVADDFTLAAPAYLTDFHWWGLYFGAGTPGTDHFTIEIYADLAAAALQSWSIVNPNRTDTGVTQDDGNQIWSYAADVAPYFLAAGRYWLSIFNDTTDDTDDNWYWSSSADSGGNAHLYTSAGWEQRTKEMAFQVTGTVVPEPGTVVLLCTGLAGLAALRRRRQD